MVVVDCLQINYYYHDDKEQTSADKKVRTRNDIQIILKKLTPFCPETKEKIECHTRSC